MVRVAEQVLVASMKVNPVEQPVVAHSPATVQVSQLAAQAVQAPESMKYPVAQVVQAVAEEQAEQLEEQATQASESLKYPEAQVVQTVEEVQTVQLEEQASQEVLSEELTYPVAQEAAVQAVPVEQAVQLEIQAVHPSVSLKYPA